MQIVSLMVGLALFSLSFATSFVERPFEETVSDAPTIVRGKAVKSWSDWARSSEGVRRIYTYTTLEVSEVIKGSVSERMITVRELGGEKDGVGMVVPGSASFNPGEDVVLTLSESSEDGSFPVRGMSMGKFGLSQDSGGEWILDVPTPHAHSDTGAEKRWTLSQLRVLVKREDSQRKIEKKAEDSRVKLSVESVTPPAAPTLQPTGSQEEGDATEHHEPSIRQSVGAWIGALMFVALMGWFGWRRRSK